MRLCRKRTVLREIPRNVCSRHYVLKSTASSTNWRGRYRRSPTILRWEDVWWWSRTIRWKTRPSFMNQGLKADVPADMPVIPPDMMPFFKELTRGAIKAAEEEIAMNPRSASVRLRAVELTRPIPERWRKRFDQGNDYASMKRQGRRG